MARGLLCENTCQKTEKGNLFSSPGNLFPFRLNKWIFGEISGKCTSRPRNTPKYTKSHSAAHSPLIRRFHSPFLFAVHSPFVRRPFDLFGNRSVLSAAAQSTRRLLTSRSWGLLSLRRDDLVALSHLYSRSPIARYGGAEYPRPTAFPPKSSCAQKHFCAELSPAPDPRLRRSHQTATRTSDIASRCFGADDGPFHTSLRIALFAVLSPP